MNKLLQVSIEYSHCGRTTNVEVVPKEDVEKRKWDSKDGKGYYFKRHGNNGYVKVLNPNYVVCPRCGGEGRIYNYLGEEKVCTLCNGEGDLNLALLDAGLLAQEEAQEIKRSIDALFREYGPHALTPHNYPYWISRYSLSDPTPAELAKAIHFERRGERDKAIETIAGYDAEDLIRYALRFLETWEKEC